MSLDIERFIMSCTLDTSQQKIQATISGLNVNYTIQVIWLSSISDKVKLQDIDSVLMDPTKYNMIDSNILFQAQKEDPVIRRVLAFILVNHHPKSHGLEQEIKKSKHFSESGIIYLLIPMGFLKGKQSTTTSLSCQGSFTRSFTMSSTKKWDTWVQNVWYSYAVRGFSGH